MLHKPCSLVAVTYANAGTSEALPLIHRCPSATGPVDLHTVVPTIRNRFWLGKAAWCWWSGGVPAAGSPGGYRSAAEANPGAPPQPPVITLLQASTPLSDGAADEVGKRLA